MLKSDIRPQLNNLPRIKGQMVVTTYSYPWHTKGQCWPLKVTIACVWRAAGSQSKMVLLDYQLINYEPPPPPPTKKVKKNDSELDGGF